MHHPTDRITHTTAFVTPIVEHWLEREIAQWVHPMKDRSDDPSHHERTLLPRSYISLPDYSDNERKPTDETPAPITGRARCSSVVKRPLMAHWLVGSILVLDPLTISRSSQSCTTGVTKALVCAILYVG